MVSRAVGLARLEDHTSHRPSALKWGNPSKPGAVVIFRAGTKLGEVRR